MRATLIGLLVLGTLSLCAQVPASARARLMDRVARRTQEQHLDPALAALDTMGTGERMTPARYHHERGEILIGLERYREAVREFHLSDSLNTAAGAEPDLAVANAGSIVESYAAWGDSGQAYLHMRDLAALTDSLNRHAAEEQAARAEREFEARLGQKETERLAAENGWAAERIAAQRTRLIGSLALAVLALGGVLLVWRNRRRERTHAPALEQWSTRPTEGDPRSEGREPPLPMEAPHAPVDPSLVHDRLHAIGKLLRSGDALGAAMHLDALTRLLRMMSDHHAKGHVPLNEAIAFLRQYLKLAAAGFPNGLRYTVDADRELLDRNIEVPTLPVEPFVENALRDLPRDQGEQHLSIRFAPRDGQVLCTVDVGDGRKRLELPLGPA